MRSEEYQASPMSFESPTRVSGIARPRQAPPRLPADATACSHQTGTVQPGTGAQGRADPLVEPTGGVGPAVGDQIDLAGGRIARGEQQGRAHRVVHVDGGATVRDPRPGRERDRTHRVDHARDVPLASEPVDHGQAQHGHLGCGHPGPGPGRSARRRAWPGRRG